MFLLVSIRFCSVLIFSWHVFSASLRLRLIIFYSHAIISFTCAPHPCLLYCRTRFFSCSQTVEWHLTRTQIGIHMRSGLASDIHKQSKLPSSSSLFFPFSLSPHYSLSPLPHSLSTSFPVKWQFCLCNSASTLNRFTWDLHKLSASFEAEAAFGVRATAKAASVPSWFTL